MHTPSSTPAPSTTAAEAPVPHDYSPSPRARRRLQLLTVTVLGAALLASAALQLTQDERGLQVALRAVADGRDTLEAGAEIPPRLRR